MKPILSLVFTLLCFNIAISNNIQVSNISLENFNDPANWAHVEFDLSWENSWRISSGPSNWDAAWVFVKYRIDNGNWFHANINQTNTNAPGGSIVEVVGDDGALIYRATDGSGEFVLQDIQIRWDLPSAATTESIIDVKVFAIEMVYIPEGSFYVGGTSGDEINKFYAGGSSTSTSFQITSEAALTISNNPGDLYYTADVGDGGDQTGTLSANYPKGFNDFYMMKYEVSQGQWIEFFNTLTETQKTNLDVTGPGGKNSDDEFVRNGVSWAEGSGASATTTRPDIPITYVSVFLVNSYLDWSALRPMTELEFEKACRGPVLPKPGEFAWGSANIASTPHQVFSAGFSSEFINNLDQNTGNAIYVETNGTLSGPKRCGILAASSVNHSREETGGSYYGVMELSGNVYERCISVGNPRGRAFTGLHGNGFISSTGEGTVGSTWPDDNITLGDGFGYRGAGYVNQSIYMRVSDRNDAANSFSGSNGRIGFRGVRTAPN
ncbi:SUMF1/EgtB/PvdO family nonheme iron enzyme [Winogradskyella sp.]|uniref:SUMF1/EgtB/PvdO family nonheme iron enzyme n=1 Tax=Winogradskyella sp. TaxID=1883156 RepID=UPI003BA9137B